VAAEDDELVQMNVRVPRSIRAAIDERRKGLTDPATGRPLSRDKWVTNAAKYALLAPHRTPTRNTVRRTAPPRP